MRIWLLALCLCWLPLAVLGAKAHPGVGLPWYSSQCPTDFPRKVNCAYGAFPYACFQDYSQDTSSCCECITSTSCTACVSSSKCNEYSRKCEGRTPFNRVLRTSITVFSKQFPEMHNILTILSVNSCSNHPRTLHLYVEAKQNSKTHPPR